MIRFCFLDCFCECEAKGSAVRWEIDASCWNINTYAYVDWCPKWFLKYSNETSVTADAGTVLSRFAVNPE